MTRVHTTNPRTVFRSEKFQACKPGIICDRGTFPIQEGRSADMRLRTREEEGRGRVSIVRVVREKTDSNDAKNTIRFRSCFSFPRATIPRNTCTDHEEKEDFLLQVGSLTKNREVNAHIFCFDGSHWVPYGPRVRRRDWKENNEREGERERERENWKCHRGIGD